MKFSNLSARMRNGLSKAGAQIQRGMQGASRFGDAVGNTMVGYPTAFRQGFQYGYKGSYNNIPSMGNYTGTFRFAQNLGSFVKAGQMLAVKVGQWAKRLTGQIVKAGGIAARWLGDRFAILRVRGAITLQAAKTALVRGLKKMAQGVKALGPKMKALGPKIKTLGSKIKRYAPARVIAEAITGPAKPGFTKAGTAKNLEKRARKVEQRTANIRKLELGLGAYGIGAAITRSAFSDRKEDDE